MAIGRLNHQAADHLGASHEYEGAIKSSLSEVESSLPSATTELQDLGLHQPNANACAGQQVINLRFSSTSRQ
jgi:hypothetical protein